MTFHSVDMPGQGAMADNSAPMMLTRADEVIE